MTRNQDKGIAQLEKHFEQFEGRFDSHLEVYRDNGKEMAALGNEVKHLGESIHELKELIKEELKPLKTRLSALEN